jgi:integrase
LRGRYRPILLTAIFTGLRASELRGLRWVDVDLDKRELHVRQRVDKRNMVGPPKSSSGERTVPLPPIVANTLKEHRLPTGAGNAEYYGNIVKRGLVPGWIAAGVVTLCVMVHQPASRWGPRASREDRSRKARSFDHRYDHGHLLASFSPNGFAFRACGGGKNAFGVNAAWMRHIFAYTSYIN